MEASWDCIFSAIYVRLLCSDANLVSERFSLIDPGVKTSEDSSLNSLRRSHLVTKHVTFSICNFSTILMKDTADVGCQFGACLALAR